MNIIGIRNRLNRAVAKMPPPPVTRESINALLRAQGQDVDAVWRFVIAENMGRDQILELAMRGELQTQINRYKNMSGNYHQKAQQ